jgi:hypothetical protein
VYVVVHVYSDTSYLAVDWSRKARAIFYDSSVDSVSDRLIFVCIFIQCCCMMNQECSGVQYSCRYLVFYVQDFDTDDSMNEKVTQKKQSVQLTECLDLFTTVEQLGEQDPW